MKKPSAFLTQHGKRRSHGDDSADRDNHREDKVHGLAQASQSTLLLKKKKEIREVIQGTRISTCISMPFFEKTTGDQ